MDTTTEVIYDSQINKLWLNADKEQAMNLNLRRKTARGIAFFLEVNVDNIMLNSLIEWN